MSADNGATWTKALRGAVSGMNIAGEWSDVPHGKITNHGTLYRNENFNQLQRTKGIFPQIKEPDLQGAVLQRPGSPAIKNLKLAVKPVLIPYLIFTVIEKTFRGSFTFSQGLLRCNAITVVPLLTALKRKVACSPPPGIFF